MNPVLETLLGHRSIRRFTDDPISDDNLTLSNSKSGSGTTGVHIGIKERK